MEVKVAKWGNSLALRLPKGISSSRNLREGSRVQVLEQGDNIMLKPVPETPSLDDLLKGVTKDNLHSPIETGTQQGKEAW